MQTCLLGGLRGWLSWNLALSASCTGSAPDGWGQRLGSDAWRVQWRAMADGNAGIPGIPGNVVL